MLLSLSVLFAAIAPLAPFAAPIAAPIASLRAGDVVYGTSTIDGTQTEVWAVSCTGERRVLATLAHRHGVMPHGIVHDGALLNTVQLLDDQGAYVQSTPLDARAATTALGRHAIASQAPTLSVSGSVLYVQQQAEGRFAIAQADRSTPLVQDIAAAWLTPVRGSASMFLLVGDHGAASQIVEVRDHRLLTRFTLPKTAGVYRSPARLGTSFVIERTHSGRSVLVDARNNVALLDGLPGLSPATCDDKHVAVGGGGKMATVVVLAADGATRTLTLGRAGIASPRACSVVDGETIAVVWVDRGAALAGELWRVSDTGNALLASQAAAYEVYGVVPSAGVRDGGAR